MERMLWIIIIQQAASISENWDYTMEKYEESPGIYYLNKSQTNLYNTESSVVVYINLKKINTQSQGIEQ